jgi:hypothetical protein
MVSGKNFRLAKLHDSIINELQASFLGLITFSAPLIYSIHNTGQPTTKVALIPQLCYQEAILQVSAVHSGLQVYIKPEYHDDVFVAGAKVCISD